MKQKGLMAFERKREGLSTFASAPTFVRVRFLRHLFAAFHGQFKPLTWEQYINIVQ